MYYSGGNVGIGTASPGNKLGVAGAISVGSSYATLTGTGATDGMIIQGNVGIGITSPGALLDVQGAAQFGSGNVNLVDSTGKIPAISSTYFASLDGSTLTGFIASQIPNLDASKITAGTLGTARGGTGATASANSANGVVILNGSGYVPANSVNTSALKTATSEWSQYAPNGTYVLTGGEYCFYPQFKFGITTGNVEGKFFGSDAQSTSYRTAAYIYANSTATAYIQTRYITASGEDFWIFLLLDKSNNMILAGSAAPDHCSYGNGGDYTKMPHPFLNYDETKHNIVILNQDSCKLIRQEAKSKNESILTLIGDEYKVDMSEELVYTPLHTGKYLAEDRNGEQYQVKELVQSLPDYISVRKLVLMTDTEKQANRALQEENQLQYEQEKQIEEQAHQNTINKLEALGLTKDELKEILK